ncbi:hypothetical protein [Haladaptatus sp. YSMS36]|uniref:hypothetical protein n=1 Tax=Haladaptatus sp. YSMS36 TaxID=3033384 RepID=UPI0023E7A362|nr:hypothetical protein [Haladaptatus sp. YSMS36]
MRVLSTNAGRLCIVLAAVFATSLTTTLSVGAPANETDHGLSEATFHTLWSGDVDNTNASAVENLTGDSPAEMRELAAMTDIPFNAPPKAVEQWNRGDLQDFPETDAGTSIHPPNATLADSVFIKDAYVEVFAVQPSTRARLSPEDRPLYVAPNGSVLATIDYRVQRTMLDEASGERTDAQLLDHRIVETRLLVDDELETTTVGSHTPTLSYESLSDYAGDEHTLTVEADIAVELSPHSKACSGESCSVRTETLTVRDELQVTEYDLSVAGYRGVYPNGDLGLYVGKNHPWLGYSLPNGEVNGVWRFYSARDSEWDTLVSSTEDGDTERNSSLQPLQVNAYPMETGPTAAPRDLVTIQGTYGAETTPPTLPEHVHLDVLTEPYTASYALTTRTKTTDHTLRNVTAHGLVRGVETRLNEGTFIDIPIHKSNLSLSVVNTTAKTVTVEATLRDAQTDEPIATDEREGSLVIAGERVNTSDDGTVTHTLPRNAGSVSARFDPGRWWVDGSGFTSDSAVVYVGGGPLAFLTTLYRIGVPVSTFLFAVFIIDRFTGWRIWPPWRGL